MNTFQIKKEGIKHLSVLRYMLEIENNDAYKGLCLVAHSLMWETD